MSKKLLIPKNSAGFTLIETLIAVLIVSIAGATLLVGINTFLKSISVSQDTIRAQNLANGKMEVIKNMPYAQLATSCGTIFPPGNIADVETVTSGGHNYVVVTYISFVDDPFDGNALGTIVGKPQDFYPFDYKRATVEIRQPVSYTAGCSAITQVINSSQAKVIAKISTSVAANAAETSHNSWILFLKVIDSSGNPVSNANIHLTNPNPNPDVDITTITDMAGLLQIPLLPEDTNNGYHLEVSLSGYSTDQTYPNNRPGYNPVNADFNILVQQVANVTLKIDLLASLQITVVNESGAPVPNLDVTVSGSEEKAIYKDPNEINPYIPKYSSTHNSGGSGVISIANLEWDNYGFSVPAGNYYIISTTPYQNVSVPAGVGTTATLKVTSDSTWPRIIQVTPILGLNNAALTVEIVGEHLLSGATMKLQKSGQSDISATGVTSTNGNTTLTGTFDLTGAAVGAWDLVVVSAGKTTRQSGGFTISAP